MDENSANYSVDQDEGFVAIANELFSKFRLSPIEHLSQCTAPVLLSLYEGILGDKLVGIIENPITREDDITNVQILIDHLQHDVLRADLSHITGEAVVSGNLLSIRYLIEILAGLLECIMEQIESEGSTEGSESVDDGDLLTSGTISSISHVLPDDFSSQSSLTRGHRQRAPATATRPVDDNSDNDSTSTNELIRLGESAASAYGLDGSVQVLESGGRSSISSTHSQRLHQDARSYQQRTGEQHIDSRTQPGTDSTRDLIREGESLARRYGVDDEPTRDDDTLIDEPIKDDTNAQNASLSTASSASWPKQPPVPTTRPPNEFDTLGLGLRVRSYGDKDYNAVDSLIKGFGKDGEDVGMSHHAHAHTHHHYHQPVVIQPGTDPIYASTFPLPSTSSSTDLNKGPQTVPPPSTQDADIRPASAQGNRTRTAPSIGHEAKASNKSVARDKISSGNATNSVTSSTEEGRGSQTGTIIPEEYFTRPIPASIRDGRGTYEQRTDYDKLPTSIHGRVGGSSITSDIYDEIPASIRDGKGTYASRSESQEPTRRRYELSKHHTPQFVSTGDAEKINESYLRHSIKPINPMTSLDDGLSHTSKDRLSRISEDSREADIDSQHTYSRVSSYQADKLSSAGKTGRSLLSREDRVAGFVPSATSDHSFSLASERYKSYLSSRLQESGLEPSRVATSVSHPPPLAAADKHSKSFPPYESIDTYAPSGIDYKLKSRPEKSSRRDPGSVPKSSSKKHGSLPKRTTAGEGSSKDSSRVRQSNLSAESPEVQRGKRHRRLDYPSAEVTRRRPDYRVTFDDDDEEEHVVSRDYSRPTIFKEFISLDSDQEISLDTHSDTEIDYSPVSDRRQVVFREGHNLRSKSRRPVAKQRSVLLPPTSKPNKVQFEDALDRDAKGEMGKIRKKLNKEKKTQERQKQVLQTVYASNLKEVKQSLKQQTAKRKQQVKKEDKRYREMYGKPRTTKYQADKKYSVSAARQSRPGGRGKVSGKRKRSASSSPVRRSRKPLRIADDEMLPTVMHEFPFVHVSPHTAHNMWNKQMRQMEQLTKAGLDIPRKNKTQMKMEEAEKRQEILLNIMKKELAHNQRMRDNKERRAAEQAMSSKAKEQRQVTARARRYYDEFRLRAKSRMLKRRTREEQIFKKLFEDGLSIQKARIRDMRAYAREKREQISSRQQNEIDSLENYYHDQFSMLAETIAKERHQLQVRDNAQNKVMEQMKREMRRKMEREIRDFQDQLYRDEDTEYFREVEADRMRRQLRMANYKTQL